MLLNEQMIVVNRVVRNIKMKMFPGGFNSDINALLEAVLLDDIRLVLKNNRQYIEEACQTYKNQTTVAKLKRLLEII